MHITRLVLIFTHSYLYFSPIFDPYFPLLILLEFLFLFQSLCTVLDTIFYIIPLDYIIPVLLYQVTTQLKNLHGPPLLTELNLDLLSLHLRHTICPYLFFQIILYVIPTRMGLPHGLHIKCVFPASMSLHAIPLLPRMPSSFSTFLRNKLMFYLLPIPK